MAPQRENLLVNRGRIFCKAQQKEKMLVSMKLALLSSTLLWMLMMYQSEGGYVGSAIVGSNVVGASVDAVS